MIKIKLILVLGYKYYSQNQQYLFSLDIILILACVYYIILNIL